MCLVTTIFRLKVSQRAHLNARERKSRSPEEVTIATDRSRAFRRRRTLHRQKQK